MQTSIETQAEREFVKFLSSQPSPEAIIGFHPSPEVTDRFYELIDLERERPLTEGEQRELNTYLYLNHLLKMMKIEAHRQLNGYPAQRS